jgi:MATE family multidrug resistance protein
MSVGAVLYMLPLGVAGAVAIRVAQECGAGRPGAVRAVAAAALGLATAWLSGSATLLLFGGGTIAALIAPGQHQVIALAAAIFAVLAAFQIMDGVQSTMLGALRGLGDTAWPAWVTLAAHWTVGLPLAWTFAHPLGFGPVGVWMGYGVGLGGAAAALLWRFVRRTAPGLAASTPGAA